MKRKFSVILLFEFGVSVILAWLLIIILPPLFQKYEIKKIDESFINHEDWLTYLDLDGDKESEKIILRGAGFFNKTDKPSNIVAYNSNNELVDQWNLKGKWYNTLELVDYNNNGHKEIILFTTIADSIFLQIFSVFEKRFVVKDRFIATGNGNYDPPANVYFGKSDDVNNDGFKDLIFSIMTSFKLSPRSLFLYDIKKDSLSKTEDFGSWRNQLIFYDLDNDSIDEIFCASTSPGNTRPTDIIKYPDSLAWLIVYNSHFELEFPPIKFGAYTSGIDVLPFVQGKNKHIAVLHKSSRKQLPIFLALYSTKGKLLREKKLELTNVKDLQFISTSRKKYNSLYFLEKKGVIHEVDSTLSITRTINLDEINSKPFAYLDIDGDENEELIFLNEQGTQMTITQNTLKYPVEVEIPAGREAIFCSVKRNRELSSLLVLKKGDSVIYYSYSENWLFDFKYLVYILIILSIFLFIRLMQTLRNYQLIKENQKLDKKVQEQTKTLKAKNKELKEANEEIQTQFQEIQAQSEEIKSQNEELYWYKERLEKLVEEKTNELAQALKKAEESDRLKTFFLQNISHEIRTPMNSIIGFMSLLEDENPKLGDQFKIITKSFNQLLNTIDDILLLSKLHIGEYNISKENVFINDFLEKLEEYGKNKIIEKNKNLDLKCTPCNHNSTVQIDFKSMQLVFEELIDNAIKYTEKGEVLNGCNVSNNNDVEFYVKDSGVGIEKNKIKYIFDAFRKLKVENKLFRGTGAGLAIVKNIINLHNAEIKVNSTPEKGTVFTVLFKQKKY